MRAAAIVLVVLGAIFLLGGIGGLAYSAVPTTDSSTVTIPSGADWYYVYDFPLVTGGHLTGSFEEVAGGTVDVFVFTDTQYKAYDGGGAAQPLSATSGSSGQLDVALPGWDTFHLIFDHGAGYDATQQDVRVEITVSGIGPPIFVFGGIVALVLGVVFLAVAAAMKRRERRAPQVWLPPQQPNVPYYPPPAWAPPTQPSTPPDQPPKPPEGGPG
ncbi:MAG TPA: hypothetical protein VF992_11675 [Thermoplasmata archaeon]